MEFSVYQSSRIGGRKYNQDRSGYAYTGEALLLVLADGMGGHLYGELAAEIAVKTYMTAFERAAEPRIGDPGGFLTGTMRAAHDDIVKYAREHQLSGNPGTTCVAALVQDGTIHWAYAGDSRLYVLRGGEAVAVTHDHSVVQQWVDWGIIGEDEMKTHPERNKITNCLGGVGDLFYPEPVATAEVLAGDVLLLCSDGLWSPLSNAEMAEELQGGPLPPTIDRLMETAVTREGARADNTTAVAARLGGNEEPHPASGPVCVMLDLGETESASDILGRTISGMKPVINA
jgi:serine/threonine protein phosphatase PrpC